MKPNKKISLDDLQNQELINWSIDKKLGLFKRKPLVIQVRALGSQDGKNYIKSKEYNFTKKIDNGHEFSLIGFPSDNIHFINDTVKVKGILKDEHEIFGDYIIDENTWFFNKYFSAKQSAIKEHNINYFTRHHNYFLTNQYHGAVIAPNGTIDKFNSNFLSGLYKIYINHGQGQMAEAIKFKIHGER